MAWLDRLNNLLRPGRLSRDLDREINTHLQERADDLVAAGMPRDQAYAEARRRFGNRGRQKESAHDTDTFAWFESVAADVRYAVRTLRHSPVFTLVAVLSLALGIGANTAIFSLTNAIALRSLPVYRPDELMLVSRGGTEYYFTNPIWEQLRDHQSFLASAFAYDAEQFNLADGGEVEPVIGSMVSGGFFSGLGVRPLAGRLIQQTDDVRGCPPIAVVSAGLAERRFGGAAAAVGRNISLDGHQLEIVGVTSRGFSGVEVGRSMDVYAPLCTVPILTGRPDVLDARSRWYLSIMVRPAAGLSIAAVNARLAQLAPAVYQATVPSNWATQDQRNYLKGKLSAVAAPAGLSDLRDTYRAALIVLMIVVGAVLLIACANIANLLLARATSRRREMAIRLAIGAGRRRLVRQLLTESLLLASAGAALGVVFARWASRLLVGMLSSGDMPVSVDLGVDARVLGFTIAVATMTGILFGLVPAWRAARTDPQSAMKSGGSVRGDRRRLGRALVAGQVALSLALVACAGLLVGSFHRLITLDPGFRREGVLLAEMNFGRAGIKDRARVTVPTQLLQQIRELPGVGSASLSWTTPLGHAGWNDFVIVDGHRPTRSADSLAYFNQASDGYFTTMGTPLLAGRDISADDVAQARSVAVINAAMATRMFGGANPIGRTFRTPIGDSASPPREVIGVVRDAKYSRINEVTPATAFFPVGVGDNPASVLTFEIRSTRPLGEILPEIKRLAAARSPAISLRFTTLSRQVSESLNRPRLLAVLSGFFGLLALALSMIGLYGTMSYSVTQRRGEIGVRLALGAGDQRVLMMVVGEAGRVVILGVVLGLGLAFAGTRLLGAFVYGVDPADPATLAISAGILAVTGLFAASIPAWRAARLDPVRALREE